MCAARRTGVEMKVAWFAFPVACAVAGCSLAVEPTITIPPEEPEADTGSVTVNWLVGGSSNPAACAQLGAREMELVIYDRNDRPVSRETASCESFTISVSLPEGRYSADVRMLGGGQGTGARKTLEDIDVIAGTDLAINVDF